MNIIYHAFVFKNHSEMAYYYEELLVNITNSNDLASADNALLKLQILAETRGNLKEINKKLYHVHKVFL